VREEHEGADAEMAKLQAKAQPCYDGEAITETEAGD